MAKWYLANPGASPIGPVRTDALLRRIRGGTLAPETLVWSEGMDDWIPVSNIPELYAEFSRSDPGEAAAYAMVSTEGAHGEYDNGDDATVARPFPQPPSTLPIIPSKVLADISPDSARTVIAPKNRGLRVPSAVPVPEDEAPSSRRDSWRTVVVGQDGAYVPAETGFPIDQSAFGPASPMSPTPPVRAKADSVTRIRPEGEYLAPRVVPGPYPASRQPEAHHDLPPRTVRLPSIPPPRRPSPSEPEATVIQPLPDPARHPQEPPAASRQVASGGTLMLRSSPFVAGPARKPSAPPPGFPQQGVPARYPSQSPLAGGGTLHLPAGFAPPQQSPSMPPPGVAVAPPMTTEGLPVAPAPVPVATTDKPKGNGTRAVIAVVFIVGLLVGIIGARKVVGLREDSGGAGVGVGSSGGGSAQNRLLVPCFSSSLPELRSVTGGKEGPCGDLTLSLKVEPLVVTLTLRGMPPDGLAAKAPELVARILPNLPQPSVSRALPLRQLLRLDLRGIPDTGKRTQAAIKTYRDAEQLVEGYEAMGGHRFARWVPKEGRLEAENAVNGDGRVIVVRFYPAQKAPSGLADAEQRLDGPDAPWKAGVWSSPVDEAYLIQLRQAMMAEGWWFDDADAFMNAAASAGLDKNADTASGVALLAEWLRASDQWDVRTRVSIWNVCLTRSISASRGFTRTRYDELAGVTKDVGVFSDSPAFRTPDEESAVYARVFAAAIGSPAHAYCATAVGQRLLEESDETAENKVIRHGADLARGIAQRLLSSSKFVAGMRTEMAKVRGQLLKPGPPEL